MSPCQRRWVGVTFGCRRLAKFKLESLILAQNERWRRALHMQVERESTFGCEYSGARVSNAWATCPRVWDNLGKLGLIPDETTSSSELAEKDGLSLEAIACGWARVPLACW